MILVVFLVPLLLGLADVSRLLFYRIALHEAAQEGALYYAFEADATPSDVIAQVVASTGAPTIDPADVLTDCTSESRTESIASEVQVTVSVDVDLIFPLLGGPVTIERTAVAERFHDC